MALKSPGFAGQTLHYLPCNTIVSDVVRTPLRDKRANYYAIMMIENAKLRIREEELLERAKYVSFLPEGFLRLTTLNK